MKATFLNKLDCRLDEFTFTKDELEEARERIAADWAWMLGPGDKIVFSDDDAVEEDEPWSYPLRDEGREDFHSDG